MREIQPSELAQWLADSQRPAPYLLDVRESWEYERCAIATSVWIPLDELSNALNRLPDECPIITICHHGIRSYHAAVFLEKMGFESVYSLAGGIDLWARTVDPNCPRY